MKFKVILTNWLVLVAAISFWGYLIFNAFEIVGIEGGAKFEDLSLTTNILSILMIASVIFAILGANLISYILIARVLKVPRHEMEKIIQEFKKSDPKEGTAILQRFYSWCLDIAYNQKI